MKLIKKVVPLVLIILLGSLSGLVCAHTQVRENWDHHTFGGMFPNDTSTKIFDLTIRDGNSSHNLCTGWGYADEHYVAGLWQYWDNYNSSDQNIQTRFGGIHDLGGLTVGTNGSWTTSGYTKVGSRLECAINSTHMDAVVYLYELRAGLASGSPPVCSFTGSPLSGPTPLVVSVSDTSNNTPTSWLWHLYRSGSGIYSITGKNWVSSPLEAGSWTVNLTATNSYGNCSLSMPGYISVSEGAGEGYVVVNLDVKDAQTGALIQGSSVGIKNTTSGVWRNSTSATGLVYFDSSGSAYEYPLSINQSITLAAGATGYRNNSVTFNIPYHNYRAYLYLLKSSVIPSAGKGTLIVNVISNKNGVSISGASVVLDTGQIGSTNTAGAVTFLNVTAGNRTATVSTPTYGYQTTSRTFDLFSGETKMLTFQLVLTGETPVPTFQPTAATTTDPITGLPASSSGDLNASGTSFLSQWARMAIAFGGLIFLFAFLYFVRAATK